jgi:hypothetical protein
VWGSCVRDTIITTCPDQRDVEKKLRVPFLRPSLPLKECRCIDD